MARRSYQVPSRQNCRAIRLPANRRGELQCPADRLDPVRPSAFLNEPKVREAKSIIRETGGRARAARKAEDHRAVDGVESICKVLQVAPSGD